MGDRTLGERVGELELAVRCLGVALQAHLDELDILKASVVMVEKRKPGPAVKSVSKKVVARGPRGGVSRKGPQIRKGFVPQKIEGLTKPWKEAGA